MSSKEFRHLTLLHSKQAKNAFNNCFKLQERIQLFCKKHHLDKNMSTLTCFTASLNVASRRQNSLCTQTLLSAPHTKTYRRNNRAVFAVLQGSRRVYELEVRNQAEALEKQLRQGAFRDSLVQTHTHQHKVLNFCLCISIS